MEKMRFFTPMLLKFKMQKNMDNAFLKINHQSFIVTNQYNIMY